MIQPNTTAVNNVALRRFQWRVKHMSKRFESSDRGNAASASNAQPTETLLDKIIARAIVIAGFSVTTAGLVAYAIPGTNWSRALAIIAAMIIVSIYFQIWPLFPDDR
jgi:hypothetical protein